MTKKSKNIPKSIFVKTKVEDIKNAKKLTKKLKAVYQYPVVKYAVAGIATAAFSKLANKLSKRQSLLTKALTKGLYKVVEKFVDLKKGN